MSRRTFFYQEIPVKNIESIEEWEKLEVHYSQIYSKNVLMFDNGGCSFFILLYIKNKTKEYILFTKFEWLLSKLLFFYVVTIWEQILYTIDFAHFSIVLTIRVLNEKLKNSWYCRRALFCRICIQVYY